MNKKSKSNKIAGLKAKIESKNILSDKRLSEKEVSGVILETKNLARKKALSENDLLEIINDVTSKDEKSLQILSDRMLSLDNSDIDLTIDEIENILKKLK